MNGMFAKVFGQIFDSSIAEDYNCRRMFMDLLVLADWTGAVDMTFEAIARRTNVPLEEVRRYIEELCQPDPTSRSQSEEGKRLVLLDAPNRDWGWQIVNFKHYREIRDQEARRSYFRDAQRRYRKKKKQKERSTYTEEDTDTGVKKREGVLNVSKDVNTLSLTERVSLIYEAYPKKVARLPACEAIRKLLASGIACDYLLERTKAFALARPDKADRYTPHPATWFRQQRFRDDPTTWVSSEKKPPSETERKRQEELQKAQQEVEEIVRNLKQ